jgi:hypothetical protein
MLSKREKWLMLQSWSQGRDEWDRWIADHEEHLAKEAPPPGQSQGSPPADCKWCEKCGGRDIHTKWVEEGEYVCPLNNGHAKKTYKMECYDKDFLRHHCRTCSFEWDTDVEPPADCKCDCESAGKIPQLEQELQGMRAKLARVKEFAILTKYFASGTIRRKGLKIDWIKPLMTLTPSSPTSQRCWRCRGSKRVSIAERHGPEKSGTMTTTSFVTRAVKK